MIPKFFDSPARLLTFLLAVALASPACADGYKMQTPIAPGVETPDKMDTSIGPLALPGGLPDKETSAKLWDNLDRSRALQAYLLAIPVVNQAGMRDSLMKFGPVNQTDVIWENPVDARTVELTANDNTIYNFLWLDTKDGPMAIEIPPKVLGSFNDFWYKWVADVGITGADKGMGGKYLLLPPGYTGDVPDGYIVVRPNTYGVWTFFRAFLVGGKTEPGVEGVRKALKIYPLAQADNPTPARLVRPLRASGAVVRRQLASRRDHPRRMIRVPPAAAGALSSASARCRRRGSRAARGRRGRRPAA